MELEGKVVVVTGASSGIGRATAEAFAKRGARLALIARHAETLRHVASALAETGAETMVLPLDVSNAAAVEAAADAVLARWGRIDVWVNDAMVSVLSPALEMTAEEFRRVTDVTYLGYVYGSLAAARRMRERGGTIVQIGSALAYRSIPLQSAYCAAKAAIRAFSDSLRTELLHDRIPVKVCMVQLPAVNTPQFDVVRTRMPGHPRPVPPAFQPEIIAEGIVHAAIHPRRELWLGWPTVKAIVAQFLIPGLLDRYLARVGYRTQQTDAPVAPGRPDNLFQPVPFDPGVHGPFDEMAKEHSLQIWLARTLSGRAMALAAGAILVAGARRWRR